MLAFLRLLLACLLVAVCGGCGGASDARELSAWTLVTPSGARRELVLPAMFSEGDLDARSHVVLETTVPLPGAWRDGPLTIAMAQFLGGATLRANGVDVPERQVGIAHSWSLGPAARQSELHLQLVLDAGAMPRLIHPPRVSATTDADAGFRLVREFNFVSSVASLAICAFLILLYGTLYLLDRRRKAHGWFVLQVASIMPAVSLTSGLPLLLMPWTAVVESYTTLLAVFAADGFFRSYFRHGRPHRAWLVGLPLLAIGIAIPRTAIGRSAAEQAVLLLVLVGILWQLGANVRELRTGRDRFPAAMLATAWILLLMFAFPDIAEASGLGVFSSGMQGTGIGIALCAVCQTLVLGRDHIRSLREAELRVAQLEERGREVEQLNEELRHQVAERSRELTEALARAEGQVAPASLEAGAVFDGRYVVTRALGRGGMGAVYEVERKRDGKRLALKVVTATLSARHAARFAREAEIGARLRHDNIVSIVDVGLSAGATPFLVMELVQGGSLEDQRQRFGDVRWALPIVRQIAAGLAELHAHRIVHRDLKPGNVLLVDRASGGPLAKISDFGVSRFGALDESTDIDVEGATVDLSTADASPRELTQTGAIMGTPLYMPPEASFGPARHPSADIFSLGVLAYEALTGRTAFAIPPVLLVRAGQTLPQPAPLDGVPEPVANLVLACLRVETAGRPSAKELAERLR